MDKNKTIMEQVDKVICDECIAIGECLREGGMEPKEIALITDALANLITARASINTNV